MTSAFRCHEKIVIIDESFLNMSTSTSESNAEPSLNYPSESSYQQDSTSSRSTYSQLVASSPDFSHSFYPFGASNSFDYYLPGIDPMEIRYDQPLSFPSTSICDTDTMAAAFSPNDPMKYFEPHLEFSPDLDSENAFPESSDRRHKGWNFLACVLRWRFSVKRILSRKSRC